MVRKRQKLELGKTLFLLPNLITLSSLFCGFDAIRLAARGGPNDFYHAAILLIFAMLFDMLDGRVARMTKTQSAFGVQIDSLVDVVSFGIAPALIVHQWTAEHHPTLALVAGFVYAACGVIRLARFNVLSTTPGGAPQKPGKYILGLPIPGAAGVLVSLILANHAAGGLLEPETTAIPLLVITFGLSFLMVSTIKFRSFKDLKLNAKTIAFVAFMLGTSAVISAKMQPAFALVWLLGFYVALALVETVWQLSRKRRHLRIRDSFPPSI